MPFVHGGPPQILPRRATVQDIAALVDLRSTMFSAMGSDVGDNAARWRVAATTWFEAQLARPQEFAGFVIEHPVEGVIAAALGICDARAPSPHDQGGARGHVFNICTDPAHRRQGHGQACLTALLTWFRTETEVRVVDLNATPEGAGIYTSEGFGTPAFPTLRLRFQR